MHPIINVASNAARQGAKVINRALNNQRDITVAEKNTNDFVTNIDVEVEETLIYHLQKAYPTHSFITEESGEIKGEDPSHVWIIDPIDGTTNFIHGFPSYAICLALKVDGITEIGVIYNPITDQLFTAVKGKGAQLNSKRLRVSSHAKLEGSLLAPSLPRSDRYENSYNDLLGDLAKSAAGLRATGSVALDLAYVAAGYIDAAWRISLSPWDYAAGVLMIREAGGVVMDINGGVDIGSGDILAANPKMAKLMLPMLKGHISK